MANSTSSALVPVFSGVISNTIVQLCDARTLHAFMQVRRDFTTWIKGRIRKFGFALGEDYLLAKSGEQVQKEVFTKSGENLGLELDSPNRGNQVRAHGGDRKSTDYHLTLDMAKELAMVENNEQGRAARRYFIECERKVLAAAAAQPEPQQMRIDVQDLLLSGQCELKTTMPPEVQAAIDRKAMAMALEAFELSKEHLRRRVAFEAESGHPARAISIPHALRAVERGGLGEALAYTYHAELRALRGRTDFLLSGAQHLVNSLNAGLAA